MCFIRILSWWCFEILILLFKWLLFDTHSSWKFQQTFFYFFYFLVSHIQNIFCVVVDRHLYSFIHSSKFCANPIWKYKCCFDVSVEATLHAVILQIEAIDFQFYMRQWYRTIIALRTIFFFCVCSLLWRKTLCEQLSNACFSTL